MASHVRQRKYTKGPAGSTTIHESRRQVRPYMSFHAHARAAAGCSMGEEVLRYLVSLPVFPTLSFGTGYGKKDVEGSSGRSAPRWNDAEPMWVRSGLWIKKVRKILWQNVPFVVQEKESESVWSKPAQSVPFAVGRQGRRKPAEVAHFTISRTRALFSITI